MTRRGQIIEALITTGFVRRADSAISTAVWLIREHGFAVSTHEDGYRMAVPERKRLASHPWAIGCLQRDGRVMAVDLPRNSLRVLAELAEERGKPLGEVATACLERGIDAELGGGA